MIGRQFTPSFISLFCTNDDISFYLLVSQNGRTTTSKREGGFS